MATNRKEKNPTFYGSQNAAAREIDRILDTVRVGNVDYINIKWLILQITKRFEVSAMMVERRALLYADVHDKEVEITNDELHRRGEINVLPQDDNDTA